MTVKLLTEHHLELLSLKGGYTGLSESTLVKTPNRWKSHVTAHMKIRNLIIFLDFLVFALFVTCSGILSSDQSVHTRNTWLLAVGFFSVS